MKPLQKKMTPKKPIKKTPKPPARPTVRKSFKKNIKLPAKASVASPTSSSTVQNSDTSWERVAEWYNALMTDKDTYQARVILPNLLRLMHIIPNERVLDLACGQGFFSGAFEKSGAAVLGADLSETLVALSKTLVPKGTFYVAPAHHIPDIRTTSIDQIVIVLALQNIENPREVFLECARVLKSGGRLHLVLNHPCFRIPKRSSWGWDENNKQYRRVDGYLIESRSHIEMHPGGDTSVTTVSFHRPLQYYIKTLSRAGLVITNLEEWTSHKTSDSGPRAPEENRSRKEIPLFMAIEARKS